MLFQKTTVRYLFCIAVVTGTFALRIWLIPLTGTGAPFVLFQKASRLIGVVVVVFAFGLGTSELIGADLAQFALPLGLTLFVVVLSVRIWARAIRSQ